MDCHEPVVDEADLLDGLVGAMYEDRARAEEICGLLFGDRRIASSRGVCATALTIRRGYVRNPLPEGRDRPDSLSGYLTSGEPYGIGILTGRGRRFIVDAGGRPKAF